MVQGGVSTCKAAGVKNTCDGSSDSLLTCTCIFITIAAVLSQGVNFRGGQTGMCDSQCAHEESVGCLFRGERYM